MKHQSSTNSDFLFSLCERTYSHVPCDPHVTHTHSYYSSYKNNIALLMRLQLSRITYIRPSISVYIDKLVKVLLFLFYGGNLPAAVSLF